MNKVLVLGGLTATGKSALAIEWAKEFDGEIISVDSVAAYRQLTIASAKQTLQDQQGIPHYGIDIADVDQPLSVKEFQQYAKAQIAIITKKKKLPILVGGSGLYLKSILYDYEFLEEPEEDEDWTETLSNEYLHELLDEIDPIQAKKIHPNNRKRVIRALSIFHHQQTNKTNLIEKQSHQLQYDALIFCADINRNILKERIDERVDSMIAQGLQAEIQLASSMADWELSSMSAIGVKEWKGYFEGNHSLEATIDMIKTKTKQFSKRQRTWFKHQFDGIWLDMENEVELKEAKIRIQSWKVR